MFETDRVQFWKESETDESFLAMVGNIAEFGCGVIHVTGLPPWSYTVGVYDTCGQPEIIVVGLKEKTAHVLLNKAARALREGIDLAMGRHREMVGEVECLFRPVDVKWVEHVMGRAIWYYTQEPPPVLQAIYPDLENHFQWEDGFEEYFRQPLLQGGVEETTTERDFLAANDPKSSLFDWKFPNSPHSTAYLSQTVQAGIEPVVYVSHDADDGAWQFLGDSMSEGGGPVISCLHHPIDNDPSLKELHDLPLGWVAERDKPGDPWKRYPHD